MLGLNPFNLTDELGYFDGDECSGLFNFSPSPALYDPKIKLFIGEQWEKSCERMKQIRRPYLGEDPKNAIKRIETYGKRYLSKLKFNPHSNSTKDAYISVDLDVVEKFPSGWKGGVWSMRDVIKTIKKIGKSKRIVGADICGLDLSSPPERPLSMGRKQKALEEIVKVHDTFFEIMSRQEEENI
jgi:hypothetical protein